MLLTLQDPSQGLTVGQAALLVSPGSVVQKVRGGMCWFLVVGRVSHPWGDVSALLRVSGPHCCLSLGQTCPAPGGHAPSLPQQAHCWVHPEGCSGWLVVVPALGWWLDLRGGGGDQVARTHMLTDGAEHLLRGLWCAGDF